MNTHRTFEIPQARPALFDCTVDIADDDWEDFLALGLEVESAEIAAATAQGTGWRRQPSILTY